MAQGIDRTAVLKSFSDFIDTVYQLRNPNGGCPWDLKQTHKTLAKYMMEEAFEAYDAQQGEDSAALCEELGDVLLQVVLNAVVADQAGSFDLKKVIDGIRKKMLDRHPHVFGGADGLSSPPKWADMKYKAIKEGGLEPLLKKLEDKTFPSHKESVRLGQIAAVMDFEWSTVQDVFSQVESEIREVSEALREDDHDHLEEEIGDVYFALAQLCRRSGIDPEEAHFKANRKFKARFKEMVLEADVAGVDFKSLPLEEKEVYWSRAKKKLKASSHD